MSWHDESGTKVKLRRDVIQTLLGLGRIRMLSLRGAYSTFQPLDVELERWQCEGAEEALAPASAPPEVRARS